MYAPWTIQETLDFFQAQGRFQVLDEYIGMSASSTPQVFADYFRQLSATERTEIARTLTDAALGYVVELIPRVGACISLVLSLCTRGFAAEFLPWRDRLEAEFTSPENIRCWLQAGDQAGSPYDGLAYKAEYRYALALSSVLILTKAPHLEPTYDHLLQAAVCTRFREALASNRALFQRRFVDCGSVLVLPASNVVHNTFPAV